MPQFLPFAATGQGDPNFPDNSGGGGGPVEIREFFPTRGIVVGDTERTDGSTLTQITLNDASNFPNSGSGFLRGAGNSNSGAGSGGNQYSQANAGVSWTGKTGNTLTGVTNSGLDPAVGRSWLHNYTVLDLNAGTENVFTYTVPSGVTTLAITGVGGGGSGGNGQGNGTAGAGGASGTGGTVTIPVSEGQVLGVRAGFAGFASVNGQSSHVSTTSTSVFTNNDAAFFPGGQGGSGTTPGRVQQFIAVDSFFGTNGQDGRTGSDRTQEPIRTLGDTNTTGFTGFGGGGGGFSIMSSGGVGGQGAAHGGGGAGGGGGGGAGWFKGIPGSQGRASGGDFGIGTAGGHGGIRISAFANTATTITFGV